MATPILIQTEPKFVCLLSSGWIGLSNLSEYRSDDDGRGPDYVVSFINTLKSRGVRIVFNRADAIQSQLPVFELHIEAQLPKLRGAPRFLLLLEDKHIRPQNYLIFKKLYRRIFSWDDDIVERLGARKFIFPSYLSSGPIGDYRNREKFLSMISSNKGQAVSSRHDLYIHRRAVLSWYQENAPIDFQLFGPDWNLPDHPNGILAKVIFKLLKKANLFSKASRPLWCGVAHSKREVLLKSKFNLCFENFKGAKGYVSEKIFDAFSAGCVPVYWGAPNILDLIPGECFIDFRRFRSFRDMHYYLKNITENQYHNYQRAIHQFAIENQRKFSPGRFADDLAFQIFSELSGADGNPPTEVGATSPRF